MTSFEFSSEHLYRPGVGMMVLNSQKQVFMAQRIDFPLGAWQMPQGGIEPEEEPLSAALRELKEEIGTCNMRVIAETQDWLSYDVPEDLRPLLWKDLYQGQRQKWFALEFKGSDNEICLETAHPELRQWQWVSLSEVPLLAVSFKQKLYEEVISEFLPIIENL